MLALRTLLAPVVAGFASISLAAADPDFALHYIDREPAWITSAQQNVLADFDGDGDLDFTAGNVHRDPNLYWYEYQDPDTWIPHFIDSEDAVYGCAAALDVNDDGQPDLISSEFLYLNGDGGATWTKHKIETSDDNCHDMQAVDVNQDGKIDILANSQKEGLSWYEAGPDPTEPWTEHPIGGPDYEAHASSSPEAVADLDGDGDLDVAAAHAWFENRDGDGLDWRKHGHTLIGDHDRFGLGVKIYAKDLDGDGDIDLVQSEADRTDGEVGWLENTDGQGAFAIRWVRRDGEGQDYHTLQVVDYDTDGDWDLFTCSGPLTEGEKHVYLFENRSGANKKPAEWKRHVLHSGVVCHEGLAGDVDGDGDIDLISKGWKTGPFLYFENRAAR